MSPWRTLLSPALPAKRNRFWREIDSDILLRISQPSKNRARAAADIENFFVAPVRQLRTQDLKNKAMQRAVAPMRLLNAKHRFIFIRSHQFVCSRVGRNGRHIAACRSDRGKAGRGIHRRVQESSVGCRQATQWFPAPWEFQASGSA